MSIQAKVKQLIERGVRIPNPESVEIGDDINIERIDPSGVVIHSGCRLYGEQTFISHDAQIGAESPATIRDCYLGPHAALKGGFFQESVFLGKSSCGLGAHVRKGTIIEDSASIAHTVGLKQTILFPYVTLGSLINFCDCLMAGGTGPRNHSEVGSAYIHFNFTPNQDKATASLIGDVPRGVMLNQSPVFLGGQGGLVGPCQIAYGTVAAAGSICRKDQLKENRLVVEGNIPNMRMPLVLDTYRNLKRILIKNINYIGNLFALNQWYQSVRRRFIGADFPEPLLTGLVTTLQKGIDERIKQLDRLRLKVAATAINESDLHRSLCENWDQIHSVLKAPQQFEGQQVSKATLLAGIEQGIAANGLNYLEVIGRLDPQVAASGSQWLQGVVDHLDEAIFSILNSNQQ